MEALPLRAGRANCMSNIQQDMIEQTLAILASMMQQAAHDATLYCAEAKRTVIMPRDTVLFFKTKYPLHKGANISAVSQNVNLPN